jgi:DNA-binding NarL/FixJ family response regulator
VPRDRRIRIVIADDSPQLRDLLTLLLDDEADLAVVGQAANGAEALLVAAEVHPDVLLLDLAMPVMDGLEVLARVRAVAPATHVIVLSGYPESSLDPEALAAADAYLEKGLAVAEVVERVRAVCACPAQPARSE